MGKRWVWPQERKDGEEVGVATGEVGWKEVGGCGHRRGRMERGGWVWPQER